MDYYRRPGEVRISVCAWMVAGAVRGMFIERPKNLWIIWNYIHEIGVVSTLHKMRSRWAERLRNRRYFCLGMGRVLESDDTSSLAKGTPVLFIASAHPRCVERVVLNALLVRPIEDAVLSRFEVSGGLLWCEKEDDGLLDDTLSGWMVESGVKLPENEVRQVMDRAEALWRSVDSANMRRLPVSKGAAPEMRSHKSACQPSSGIRACIFGLGNYAKTQIIPSMPKGIRVVRVHESDPTQIGQIDRLAWPADTNPNLNNDESYDVIFVAGYHHTHAELAIRTIERGGYAVVEKPVVTDRDQLVRMAEVLKQYPGRLFACFHMRYNPLSQRIWRDLDVQRGEPIHYYCTVFEVCVPPRHWYRWPNSRGHIISNGCHWLDHFLCLNDYSVPAGYDIIPCSNGDSLIHVELANGAVMGMHITHAGSERLGVRDHVEMRANGRTAILESGSRYLVESCTRVLKQARGNRVDAYRTMYRSIGEKILRGEGGDTFESLFISHNLALDLEELRCRKTASKTRPVER